MAFKWKTGARAPKGVSADDVAAAIQEIGTEAQAEDLLERSKNKQHVLHNDLWEEGDQVWANRARLQRCRELIAAVAEETIIGGVTYEVRAFEFVRGAYRTLESISEDQDLLSEFIEDIADQMGQFQAKLKRIRSFKK